jgi:hypothetical protein
MTARVDVYGARLVSGTNPKYREGMSIFTMRGDEPDTYRFAVAGMISAVGEVRDTFGEEAALAMIHEIEREVGFLRAVAEGGRY